MKTIVDPDRVSDIEDFHVTQHATFTFSSSGISEKQLAVHVKNMRMDDQSVLAAPVMKDELDTLLVDIAQGLSIVNSTIANAAHKIIIGGNQLKFLESSLVKYHTEFDIYAKTQLLVNGTITQNDPITSRNDGKPGIVKIYSKESLQPTFDGLQAKGVITFANASVVRADSIMVYSDIIQLDGAIENAVETQEGGRQILGSCIKVDNVTQDVFRCVPKNDNRFINPFKGAPAPLDNKVILDTYNAQYNTSYTDVRKVYDKMPDYFSIYIQAFVNATQGGCSAGEGDGIPDHFTCCNYGGSGYGGEGKPGSFNPEIEKCGGIPDNCSDYRAPNYGDENSKAYQGSGGAGLQGGKGGGIIWLDIANHFNLSGTIESRGSDSETQVGATYGSGGGSGGSISITTYSIEGSSSSVISVAGGDGKFGGGGGAGGWIYGYILDSLNTDHFPEATQDWFGKFNISAGKDAIPNLSQLTEDEDIHEGKISHPTCLAGYEKAFCSPCIQGFYKPDNSKNDCIVCNNKPSDNSLYIRKPGEQTKDQ